MRSQLLLAFLPAVGLAELALHEYFARRAPDFADYAALAPELLKQKQPGVPVVVAPAWAEPLVRQAAPGAFPVAELARADDSAFTRFIEVSLLGQSAPELAGYSIEAERRAGPFTLRVRKNPRPEPVLFDFVSAVDDGAAEVFMRLDDALVPCLFHRVGRATTGGLHGHIAYPAERYECPGGRSVGVTLLDDATYRARRCILVQPPVTGSVLLRFSGLPNSPRFVGFRGVSYFLERDDASVQAELTLREPGQEPARVAVVGAAGWARFEQPRSVASDSLEVEVRAFRPGVDACFALEAR